MRHFSYLAVLAACLLGTAPLEVFLRTRVYARWRRLVRTLVPVLVVFVGWDLYAIARGQWTFDPRGVTGVRLPGGIPLEEALFFVVVPICAILTLEAVRARRHDWTVGDEPPPLEPAPLEPAPLEPALPEPAAAPSHARRDRAGIRTDGEAGLL
ncbi:lycopene cyclase domain-containing protein [Pseudofrankia asymbiotica]|uniref:lycopene cyclase domain-containing protein n=1 Tax=Pseudofrankia asymbiotica TaxID=1834516 RepID=UPI001F516568|nr:lycopene cyclase domain-containing protein [Pseudofrankia asymbiotica]